MDKMSIKLRPLNHVIQNQITLSQKLSPQDKYSKSGIFKMLNKGTRREDKYCLYLKNYCMSDNLVGSLNSYCC